MKFFTNKIQSIRYHQRGMKLEKAGKIDEAIESYHTALEYDVTYSFSYYNLGLIYKYLNDWETSAEYNKKAIEYAPDDEAAIWNLGIAATAMSDWATARNAWKQYGIKIDDGEGEILMDFGLIPVRLNPDGSGEVVWGRRIDPARVVISNVPLPGSGFHTGDIVLSDGAPVGNRILNGQTYDVFNVLSLWKASDNKTYEAIIFVPNQDSLGELFNTFDVNHIAYEDWTETIREICRACSEGTHHEATPDKIHTEWKCGRRIGLSCVSISSVESILGKWSTKQDRKIISLKDVT